MIEKAVQGEESKSSGRGPSNRAGRAGEEKSKATWTRSMNTNRNKTRRSMYKGEGGMAKRRG